MKVIKTNPIQLSGRFCVKTNIEVRNHRSQIGDCRIRRYVLRRLSWCWHFLVFLCFVLCFLRRKCVIVPECVLSSFNRVFELSSLMTDNWEMTSPSSVFTVRVIVPENKFPTSCRLSSLKGDEEGWRPKIKLSHIFILHFIQSSIIFGYKSNWKLRVLLNRKETVKASDVKIAGKQGFGRLIKWFLRRRRTIWYKCLHYSLQ
jgi:hypothetical protein